MQQKTKTMENSHSLNGMRILFRLFNDALNGIIHSGYHRMVLKDNYNLIIRYIGF